jgi:enoyl-CoA hydratase/carnithine racemase
MTTLNAKIAFNEVTFGFVPHSGATYYLSHLPGEFGTFMALTGLPINGSDAAQIELTKGVIHDPKYYAEKVGDYVRSIEFPGQKGSELFQPSRDNHFLTPWEQYLFQKYASKDQIRREDFSRLGS